MFDIELFLRMQVGKNQSFVNLLTNWILDLLEI